MELIEKKFRRRWGEEEAYTICRAWQEPLEGRLNTGYQIWTQYKSLSSGSPSHSLCGAFLWGVCILCITTSNLHWGADSVHSRRTELICLPLDPRGEPKELLSWRLSKMWVILHPVWVMKSAYSNYIPHSWCRTIPILNHRTDHIVFIKQSRKSIGHPGGLNEHGNMKRHIRPANWVIVSS